MKKTKKITTLVIVVMVIMLAVLCACEIAGAKTLSKITGVKIVDNNIVFDGSLSSKAVAYIDKNEVTIDKNKVGLINGIENFLFEIKSSRKSTAEVLVAIDFKKLPTLALSNEGAKVSWSNEELKQYNNVEYIVRDNNIDTVIKDNFYTIPTDGVAHNVKVRAQVAGDNSFYSSFSDEISVQALATPENILYDNVSKTVTWMCASGADSYKLIINNQEFNTSTTELSADGIDISNGLNIKIMANSEKESIIDSSYSEEKKYSVLEKINESSFKINGSKLSWMPVQDENLRGYQIKINGVTSDSQQYFSSKPEFDIPSGEQHAVSIKAISNGNTISEWSEEINLSILIAPVLRYNKEIFFINNPQSTADSYEYEVRKVNKDLTEEVIQNTKGSKSTIYVYGFEVAGTYRVYAKAIAKANQMDILDSAFSDPVEVVRLSAPNRYSLEDVSSPTKPIVLRFVDVSPDVKEYELLIDDVAISSNLKTTFNIPKFANYDENIYVVKVRSRAISTSESNSKIVLDSLDELTIRFKKLAVPRNLFVSKESLDTVEWSSIDNSNGYGVKFVNLAYVKENKYTLPSIAEGLSQIQIFSRGKYDSNLENGGSYITGSTLEDDSIVLSSDYATPISFYKLPRVSNLSLKEGTISFDAISGSYFYKYLLNNEPLIAKGMIEDTPNGEKGYYNTASLDLRNMEGLETSSAHAISVIAIGNINSVSQESGEIPYLNSASSDSLIISKIGKTTAINASDDNISWNRVNSLEINYEVYRQIGDTEDYSLVATVGGLSYNIKHLKAGKHTFKIKATSKGYDNFIDGDISDVSKTFIKLPKVEVMNFYSNNQGNISNGEMEEIDTEAIDLFNANRDSYIFKKVESASKYTMYIDGVPSTIQQSDNKYIVWRPNFAGKESYNVRFCADGDGGLTTVRSDDTVIKQVCKKIETPYGNDSFSFDFSNKTLTLTALQANNIINRYEYEFNGNRRKVIDDNTVTYDIDNSVSERQIKMRFSGEVFGEGNVYYFSSDYADAKELTIFNQVDEKSINVQTINNGYKFSWKSLNTATYRAYFVISGLEGKQVYETAQVSLGTNSSIEFIKSEENEKYFNNENYKITLFIKVEGNTTNTFPLYEFTSKTYSMNI